MAGGMVGPGRSMGVQPMTGSQGMPMLMGDVPSGSEKISSTHYPPAAPMHAQLEAGHINPPL